MKYSLLFLLSIALYFPLRAQNADPLVNAEKAFEKTCLEKGIRDGFLAHVDSNAIIFTGKGPVNAKQFWASLPVLKGVFSWSASYAEMSISGDWGYTTGNYEHRANTLADTVNDSGQYNTVWHKTENGEWKYLFDMGNAHPPAPLDKYSKTITIEKISDGNKTNSDNIMYLEKGFILSYEKNISDAYQKSGSEKYILNITGYGPVTSTDLAMALIKKNSPAMKYQPAGTIISPGKDLAAVYGSFDRDNGHGSYLRIWRHEKNGWKIALEVIRI
jgi:hypothetical protein